MDHRDTLYIDLLRHGEPVGGQKYRGGVDDPLSERGWEQMRYAASGETPWRGIVTSPLRRCREFAEELGLKHQIPVATDPRLREVGFGEWEGLTKPEVLAKYGSLLGLFLQDPVTHRPPGAESLHEFAGRVSAGFDDVLKNHLFEGGHVLVICHAGVIRAILHRVLSIPLENLYRIQVQTGHVTRIRIDAEGRPAMMFHGRRRL